MKPIFDYILTRLTERSTWVGLTGIFTALGVTLAPQHATLIATVGAALAGGIQAVVRDHKPVLIAVAEAIEPAVAPDSKD